MALGDFRLGAAIDFKWNSQGLDGSSITLGVNGTLRIFKSNSLTPRSSAAGITFSEDFSATTGVLVGVHHLRILTSDDTDPGFWAANTEYQIVGDGIVVDGKTVNTTLEHFSIERVGGSAAMSANPSGFKKNTAVATFDIVMTSTAGVPLTGLVVTAKRRLDASAFALCANSVTEVSDGVYTLALNATDMNADKVTLMFTATSAKPLLITIYTEP